MLAQTSDEIRLPLLGRRSAAAHQRVLLAVFFVSLLLLLGVLASVLYQSNQQTAQLRNVEQAMAQSQRVGKSLSEAMGGRERAFAELAQGKDRLGRHVNGLKRGDEAMQLLALEQQWQPLVDVIDAQAKKVDQAALNVLAQKQALLRAAEAIEAINASSITLLEKAEAIAQQKLMRSASPTEVSAAGQLVVLTQRIAKSANAFLMTSAEPVSKDAVLLLGKDLNSFENLLEALKSGSKELKISPAADKDAIEKIDALAQLFKGVQGFAQGLLDNLEHVDAARMSALDVLRESEPLRLKLEELQVTLSQQGKGVSPAAVWTMTVVGLLVLLSAIGWEYTRVQGGRAAAANALQQAQSARVQEEETRRLNEVNQAAILRLMNELQVVADGDLTQQATVTESITGAIADSVNYTVEELRALVGQVQGITAEVAQTTQSVSQSSAQLLADASVQTQQTREAGQSLLNMAHRITGISGMVDASTEVTGRLLHASKGGLDAVQGSLMGMHAIREQIQETAKRMKRLGESTQEIGDITNLIADITEQTNVLALNAAIQAATAGEAGRGFTVVAEEVQRLAERSAEATRQIAGLVKTIQVDAQETLASMENSIQGVLRGGELAQNAGAALEEMDKVSLDLAALMGKISTATTQESQAASGMAHSIELILDGTEKTMLATRRNDEQVAQLATIAQTLGQSVARFKVA